jgi:predicted acetyltransferase
MGEIVKRGNMKMKRILIESLDKVFRPNSKNDGSSMYREFPHLFSDKNINNTYYIEKNGFPVSQASILTSIVILNGISLRVASLGSVSTWKEYRHKGYSTEIINKIIDDCVVSGVDLLIVSGEIELYTKLGCIKTGRVLKGIVKAVNDISSYTVEKIESEERVKRANLYHKMYSRESYRYLRTLTEFQNLLDSLWFKRQNFRMDLFEIKNANEVISYVIAYKKNDDDKVSVIEYAGSRVGFINSLSTICGIMGSKEIIFNVQPEDTTLYDLCKSKGIALKESFTQGTIRILNEKNLFKKLELLFLERFGSKPLLHKIRDNSWDFSLKDFSRRFDGIGDLTSFIFGYDDNDLKIPLMFTDDLNYI